MDGRNSDAQKDEIKNGQEAETGKSNNGNPPTQQPIKSVRVGGGSTTHCFGYDIFYKNGTHEYKSETVSYQQFTQQFGIYFSRDTIDSIKSMAPHLISTELAQYWEHKKEKKKAKLKSLFDENKVTFMEISDICEQSSPCKHGVTIHTKDGKDYGFGKCLRANEIAEYAGYLNEDALRHVWIFIEEKIEGYKNNLMSVHINYTETNLHFASRTISSLLLQKNDGTNIVLKGQLYTNPNNIADFFSMYLDEDAISDPEIRKLVTPDILKTRAEHFNGLMCERQNNML